MQIVSAQIPVMATHVPDMLGYVSHRHPPLGPLRKKLVKLIEDLEAIGSYELSVRWVTDEEKFHDALLDWQAKLGSVLSLKNALESDGMRSMRQDVRRFFPDLRGRFGDAVEQCIYVADEIVRYIRDAILSSTPGPTLLDHDLVTDEPGPSEDFDW